MNNIKYIVHMFTASGHEKVWHFGNIYHAIEYYTRQKPAHAKGYIENKNGSRFKSFNMN